MYSFFNGHLYPLMIKMIMSDSCKKILMGFTNKDFPITVVVPYRLRRDNARRQTGGSPSGMRGHTAWANIGR